MRCPTCQGPGRPEADTFELGLNKVVVTFERMRCRRPSCARIYATASQSLANQRRLRGVITRVKIPYAWPKQEHSPWGASSS